jgi:hypothetical protein
VTDYPRPGEVDAILARSRARRRRHATAALGGTAGLLLLVAVAAGGIRPNADARLEPAGRLPGVAATGTVPPRSGRSTATAVPLRPPGPPTRSTVAAVRPGTVAPQDTAGPVLPANGTDPVARPYAERPDMSARAATGKGASCRDRVVDPNHPSSWIASGAWCLRFGMTYMPAERIYDPEIEICRDVDDAAGSVSFPTGQEVEFVLRTKAGAEVWRWSRGQVFARTAHTVTVQRGDCRVWTFTYDATDDYGTPLPRGPYVLRGAVVSPSFRGRTLDMDLDVS